MATSPRKAPLALELFTFHIEATARIETAEELKKRNPNDQQNQHTCRKVWSSIKRASSLVCQLLYQAKS